MPDRKTPDSTGAHYHQPRNVEEMTEQNVQTIVQLEETARPTAIRQIRWRMLLLNFAAASRLYGFI